MFEIIPSILSVLIIIVLFVRLRVISLAAHFAHQYGEKIKRTIKEKTSQLNISAGRF
jgi:hypothetical protein